MSWSREKTRRGWEARNQRRSNSLAVSATSPPALRTSRASPSSTTSPKERAPRWSGCVDARRSSARTRAASSRPELEPDDPVRLLAARGQQDDRQGRARADRAAEREAVSSREHHVQHNEVE